MNVTRAVRQERTGWRDEGLSLRHRDWGYDVPAVDLDFLLLEYDRAKPVAVVEYKHERAAPVRTANTSFSAMRELADRAGVLFLYVRYKGDFSRFDVSAQNSAARAALGVNSGQPVLMSEEEYVAFLHRVRREAVHDPALRFWEFIRSFGCLACGSCKDVGTVNLSVLRPEVPESLLAQLGRWGAVPACANCQEGVREAGAEVFGGWELATANAAVLMARFLEETSGA